MEGTMENNCLPYFVEGILFLFAFSRVVFSEMPRVLGEVVCWQLVGSKSCTGVFCLIPVAERVGRASSLQFSVDV